MLILDWSAQIFGTPSCRKLTTFNQSRRRKIKTIVEMFQLQMLKNLKEMQII
jgi:hypothetical protein